MKRCCSLGNVQKISIETCGEKRRKFIKAIQNKILALVIGSIFISTVVIMVIAFSNYSRIVENNSRQIMQLMCSEKRQAIDEKLLNIEQSVHTLYHYAIGQMNEEDNLWQNENRFREHIGRMKALIETTARYTDGAVRRAIPADDNEQ